ncbi:MULTISPECIES: FAD-dependent oxidoreductase [Streptomyces]|jgi:2-polyprenyl-6-methoxyphenol hydroxylase-like FAD-dependent oxidoreductase|uniref:FAD-dependent oxidoreductase n=1 Tax=unclassified Streptomyces TaxID=2593676 RepID=UPI000884F316|nr:MULTISPECIES: FAD-dependent oxidoreductase [unclassified Streptomyces]SCY12246.1 FAD dependent oxidoreductase [Streptomyces sp. 136MFCol5.1]SFS91066.1 FAD dependent oxidoreductase [Streptomyces sp. ok210]
MPHALTELKVRTVTKPAGTASHRLDTDVCVVGAGVSGISAAIESAQLGREVVLVDSLPVLGGQMVNSLIGLFCGVYGNGPDYRQLTHGIFDGIFADLEASGDLHVNRGHTITVTYDEVALGRWVERRIRELGIRVVLGASITGVERDSRRIAAVSFATRHGTVRVTAPGFVDATGDAALAWEAGLACRVPERTIYGSQQIVLEHLHEEHQPGREELAEHVHAKAPEWGLVRRDGLAFFFPGRSTAVLNMTHIPAPLDPVEASAAQLDGREQADRVVEFLRAEFPKAFGEAKVRSYGLPGRRQTRWIKGSHQLSLDEVRAGTRFEDAVARTAWPIELHDRADGYVWETFDADHVHYVPLRSLLSPDCDNLVAAGRCADGDAAALSSVRVMGPCAAMGAGAAHTLDLAGRDGSVHGIDLAALRARLAANVDD